MQCMIRTPSPNLVRFIKLCAQRSRDKSMRNRPSQSKRQRKEKDEKKGKEEGEKKEKRIMLGM